jgi:hypothetical protein
MSHFLVGVIVTPDSNVEQAVERLLAPFNENIEVPEYQRPCSCIGRDKESPDPDCEECHGSGTHPSQYNPDSKWDWYQIGGRWDGVICKLPPLDVDPVRDAQAEFAESMATGNMSAWLAKTQAIHEQLSQASRNVCPVKDWDRDLHAVVTPDGVWHQCAEMGWWGMTRDEKNKEVWERELKDIQEKHIDQLIVGVDCHI